LTAFAMARHPAHAHPPFGLVKGRQSRTPLPAGSYGIHKARRHPRLKPEGRLVSSQPSLSQAKLGNAPPVDMCESDSLGGRMNCNGN